MGKEAERRKRRKRAAKGIRVGDVVVYTDKLVLSENDPLRRKMYVAMYVGPCRIRGWEEPSIEYEPNKYSGGAPYGPHGRGGWDPADSLRRVTPEEIRSWDGVTYVRSKT